MGCCESSPNNNGLSSSSPTHVERIIFEHLLAGIPVHCRQDIINLTLPEHFINAYQYHILALVHLQRNEYLPAISNETDAIKQMERLLPYHHDHLIFAEMYKLLAICLWKIGEIKLSLSAGYTALDIIIKNTPTNYTEISFQYCQLAFICLSAEAWKGAERFFMKTIETARLSNQLQQDYIQQIQALLEATRKHLRGSPLGLSTGNIRSNPGESKEDFIHRIAADLIPVNDEIGKFNIDGAELTRLPDKQMESQITDEILNEVLKDLETYLKENIFLCKFGIIGGSMSFIAAYFKDTQMKTSSLSPAMVEAALTIIINRIDDKNTADNERFAAVKQSPFTISFTDDAESNIAGVRVFQVKRKDTSSEQ